MNITCNIISLDSVEIFQLPCTNDQNSKHKFNMDIFIFFNFYTAVTGIKDCRFSQCVETR